VGGLGAHGLHTSRLNECAATMPQRGNCLLCQEDAELQHSHVLPAFAFRWLRESSGSGFIRTSRAPNLRAQDGEKRYWLCSDCEQDFGELEKAFSERLFQPYLAKSGTEFRYAHWLSRFCVSVSWRVLQFFLEGEHLHTWSPESLECARRAELAWREYLTGSRRRPGEFQQHILPLDRIESTTAPMVPNINRYLMRAIAMDVCRGTKMIFTFAKLGRFVILGIVRDSGRNEFQGTLVHPAQGVICPRKYILPKALMGYFNDKAQTMAQALSSMSDRQLQTVDATFRANIDRYMGSDAFEAMNADVEMFGDNAFSQRDEEI
jgi:hypothetical protein